MNKEEIKYIKTENGYKVSMPLITNEELDYIDFNFHSIVDEYFKGFNEKKEKTIEQRLIYDLEQENKKYKEVIDKAINIAYEYGQIDGAHHKTWVIDQMIRQLIGTEYDKFIKEYEEDGEYTWDIGIAP